MISLLQNLLLAFLLGSFAAGTPIEKRQPKFIAHEFEDIKVPSVHQRSEVYDFDDRTSRYVIYLKMGSEQQKVEAHIDTGSFRWEIPGPNSICNTNNLCKPEYVFDSDKSTSFKNSTVVAKPAFGADKTHGYIVTDDIYLDNGDKVPQFQFDLLDLLKKDYRGILGSGYSTHRDASFALAAKDAGLIDHSGYSIFKTSDKGGTYLLGAVDRAKYDGDLHIEDSTGKISVDSITLANGTVVATGLKFTPDTGVPYLIMLDSVVDDILKEVGADDKGQVPCDQVLNGNKSLSFQIGSLEIPVYYKDFFVKKSGNSCGSAIHRSTDRDYQFVGLPFIRNAYIAHNFDTKKMAIAPVKHTDESDVVDFWF
ncbi:SAP98 [Candida metapsilosis]|uniref:SAP98 n=1 Tax=Candida metapsilosis TaxID=273372 RepID=A0A8H8DD49_9ASCO|nr:SAP98 [Candida metapsilosis]